MSAKEPSETQKSAARLELSADVAAAMVSQLPTLSQQVVAAVMAEVPSYSGAWSGPMGRPIAHAVQLALTGFLRLAAHPSGSDPGTPRAPAVDAAYDLGRGEARSGRSMDVLLAAFRVGARVSWREMAQILVAGGADTATTARFAELMFAYIDELSGASVSGHVDELATTGQVRQRYLERLGHALLSGAAPEAVVAAAERAA
jgi:hypothetical protein